MLEIIQDKFNSIWDYMISKGGLLITLLTTAYLSAIGYPKQVIIFILFLIPVDIITRWYAIVVTNYGEWRFLYFINSWKQKFLNSKKFKKGLFLKIFFYSIFLYIAHQCSITEELAFGKLISNFLYSAIIVLDLISITENAIDAGFDKGIFFLKYFRDKKENLLNKKEK